MRAEVQKCDPLEDRNMPPPNIMLWPIYCELRAPEEQNMPKADRNISLGKLALPVPEGVKAKINLYKQTYENNPWGGKKEHL